MATSTVGERITRLETEMNHVATKADVESVRTDMANMQANLVKWMAGLVIGVVLSVGLGVVNLLVRVLAN